MIPPDIEKQAIFSEKEVEFMSQCMNALLSTYEYKNIPDIITQEPRRNEILAAALLMVAKRREFLELIGVVP